MFADLGFKIALASYGISAAAGIARVEEVKTPDLLQFVQDMGGWGAFLIAAAWVGLRLTKSLDKLIELQGDAKETSKEEHEKTRDLVRETAHQR